MLSNLPQIASLILGVVVSSTVFANDWHTWGSDKDGVALFRLTATDGEGARFVFRSEDASESPAVYARHEMQVKCHPTEPDPLSIVELEVEEGNRDSAGKSIPKRVESFRSGRLLSISPQDPSGRVWKVVGRDVCAIWRENRN